MTQTSFRSGPGASPVAAPASTSRPRRRGASSPDSRPVRRPRRPSRTRQPPKSAQKAPSDTVPVNEPAASVAPPETAAIPSPRESPEPRSSLISEPTDHRHPTAGIPAVDWLSGFTTAAVEVFGENWEPRLAAFLAFLRRRLTGDYSVDEYGFDAEITQRFFMTAIRPVAEKWFRIEVRGVENIPAVGGALVVSNHSGTIPIDGMMTAISIHDHARTGSCARSAPT